MKRIKVDVRYAVGYGCKSMTMCFSTIWSLESTSVILKVMRKQNRDFSFELKTLEFHDLVQVLFCLVNANYVFS